MLILISMVTGTARHPETWEYSVHTTDAVGTLNNVGAGRLGGRGGVPQRGWRAEGAGEGWIVPAAGPDVPRCREATVRGAQIMKRREG
jgi:hypothetical protein